MRKESGRKVRRKKKWIESGNKWKTIRREKKGRFRKNLIAEPETIS